MMIVLLCVLMFDDNWRLGDHPLFANYQQCVLHGYRQWRYRVLPCMLGDLGTDWFSDWFYFSYWKVWFFNFYHRDLIFLCIQPLSKTLNGWLFIINVCNLVAANLSEEACSPIFFPLNSLLSSIAYKLNIQESCLSIFSTSSQAECP